jgi:long-chain acyl-CoA synthetase
LVSNNRPEWNIVDLAVLQIGAINVPIYPTISSSEYEFIFNNAEIKFCFVSDSEIYKKVNAIFEKVPSLQEIFSFDSIDGVRKWTDILDVSNIEYQEKVEQLKSQVKGSDLATLIYTSGTTGVPKGVMLSHNNLVSNVLASQPR